MWWFLLVPLSVFAQIDEKIDLETIRLLDRQLPTQELIEGQENREFREQNLRFRHPYQMVSMEQILKSEIEYGYIKSGKTLIRLTDKKAFTVSEAIYAKFYKLEDEQGFIKILKYHIL